LTIKTAVYIFLILTIFSCTSDERASVNSTQVPFNLENDYINFEDHLHNGDSLKFIWNLGVCMGSRIDTIVFTKFKNEVYLEGTTYNQDIPSQSTSFNKTKYVTKDTLSFKNSLQYFKKEFRYIWIHPATLSIIYKTDTLTFVKNKTGLIAHLNFIEKYNSIMKLSYPFESKFDSFPKIQTIFRSTEPDQYPFNQ